MNRKTFIKTCGLSALAFTHNSMLAELFDFGIESKEDESAFQLSILSTNDVHSHIEPFSASAGPELAGRGGFARRAYLIEQIRKTVPDTLLLDAGDIFQGTPYFNMYGGELELKLMSEMGYDAATIGNHEFDNGLEGIGKQLPNANFPFVCANYDFSNTILNGKIRPYKILQKSQFKIGVFGLGVELEHLVSRHLYKETKYHNPIEVAQSMVRTLKAQGCNLIICLSHIGYDYPHESHRVSDLKLAAATENIDLIIGGHTHTFLSAPQIMANRKGKPVIISQLGWGGTLLGRIDVKMQNQQKVWAYQTYLLDENLHALTKNIKNNAAKTLVYC